jgi:hypothetical protein
MTEHLRTTQLRLSLAERLSENCMVKNAVLRLPEASSIAAAQS